MITRSEIFGTEELILERNPRANAVYQETAETARATIIELTNRFGDSTDESTQDRYTAELDAITTRSLAEYARKAAGLFSAEELELWTSKIRKVSGNYVGRAAAVGVPGALLLMEALEEAELGDEAGHRFVSLDDTLANGAEYCQCGYATTREIPKKFCFLCSEALLNEWRAEEDRLLARAPDVSAALDAVFDGLLTELAEIYLAPGDSSGTVRVRRKAGESGLARVNEERASSIAALDVSRWDELATLNESSGIEVVSADGRHWARWGLGSARATGLALRSSPEIEKRMRAIAGPRPAPKPSFFEKLFSRR